MVTELDLGGISVEIVQKDIKNMHLSVNPPSGKVRISAPKEMDLQAIRAFALTKLSWIKQQQRKFQFQEREMPREFLELESHYVWGKRYLLNILETDQTPSVTLAHDKIVLAVKPNTSPEKMQDVVDDWYRSILREEVPAIIEKWSAALGVKPEKLFIQRMKTKWGGCTPENGSIRLNTELAKKPIEFLEYVVLHELAHLKAPNHGDQFQRIMDAALPNWRQIRDELNRLPVPHGEWN